MPKVVCYSYRYGLLQLHCTQGDVHKQGKASPQAKMPREVCYNHRYRYVDT